MRKCGRGPSLAAHLEWTAVLAVSKTAAGACIEMPKKAKRQFSEEQKLEHQSSKAVTQALKKARGFMVQKCVRALRDLRDTEQEDGEGVDAGAGTAKATSAMQRDLDLLKSKDAELSTAVLVRQALRRPRHRRL